MNRCEICGDNLFTVEEQEAGICGNPECQAENMARREVKYDFPKDTSAHKI